VPVRRDSGALQGRSPVPSVGVERRLTNSFEELIDAYSEYETPDLRTAAYTIALNRNATAHAYRGLFP